MGAQESPSRGCSSASNARPASVGATLRVVRCRSGTPRDCSSVRTAWLSADGETFMAWAARRQSPSSALCARRARTKAASTTRRATSAPPAKPRSGAWAWSASACNATGAIGRCGWPRSWARWPSPCRPARSRRWAFPRLARTACARPTRSTPTAAVQSEYSLWERGAEAAVLDRQAARGADAGRPGPGLAAAAPAACAGDPAHAAPGPFAPEPGGLRTAAARSSAGRARRAVHPGAVQGERCPDAGFTGVETR